MLRTWLVVGIAVLLTGAISAQDPVAPGTTTSVKIGALPEAPKTLNSRGAGQPAAETIYVIEMRVLEGTGLIEDGSKRKAANLPRGVKARRAGSVPATAEKTAVLPQPSPPPRVTRAAEAPANLSEEDLWDDSSRRSGITVVAAPKVTLDPKQPVTVQIQTEAIFTYLVPLGSGKFEAKQSDVHELGMKFTMQVEPVDGDDEFVDVAPLEIHITSLDGREPVEGLDLDVGKPIVATRSLKTSAKVK